MAGKNRERNRRSERSPRWNAEKNCGLSAAPDWLEGRSPGAAGGEMIVHYRYLITILIIIKLLSNRYLILSGALSLNVIPIISVIVKNIEELRGR